MEVLDDSPTALDEVPTGAPLAPSNMGLLFTRPATFFSRNLDFEHTGSLLVAALVAGMARTLERVSNDENGLYADATWPGFWAGLVVVGAISGGFTFFVGGWWYRVRIGFAGDDNVDADEARQIYTYITFVEALPAVAIIALVSPFYGSFGDYVASDQYAGLVVVPFFFLSCLASYQAVTTRFRVEKGKALIWFLLLPVIVAGAALLLAIGVMQDLF
jgi:hypothetical protein